MRRALVPIFMLALGGCYRDVHVEQREPTGTTFLTSSDGSITARPPPRVVTFERTVSMGPVDTSQFCAQPVRSELRRTGGNMLTSVLTFGMVDPRTLYVTCEVP